MLLSTLLWMLLKSCLSFNLLLYHRMKYLSSFLQASLVIWTWSASMSITTSGSNLPKVRTNLFVVPIRQPLIYLSSSAGRSFTEKCMNSGYFQLKIYKGRPKLSRQVASAFRLEEYILNCSIPGSRASNEMMNLEQMLEESENTTILIHSTAYFNSSSTAFSSFVVRSRIV